MHFWHAQNEFPFFVYTCIDIQFESSRVQQYDHFYHSFHDGLYCSEVTFRVQCCWSRMFDLYTVKYC